MQNKKNSKLGKICFGCSACVTICPQKALSLMPDEEGFLRPRIDQKKCNQCSGHSLCKEVCPALQDCIPDNEYYPKSYAFGAEDNLRKKSASGAVFPVLAEYFLETGGYVCGAVWKKDWSVAHIVSNERADMEKMRDSKYVQSNMEDCYAKINSLLKQGKKVLFTGTPCQVAGLKGYLRGERENLYCVDLLCHGAASPLVFKQYLRECLNKDETVTDICLRDKKLGWKAFVSSLYVQNEKGRKYRKKSFDYGRMYITWLSVKEECFDCKFRTFPRQADLSMGDFFSIGGIDESLDDDKGLSIVISNNEQKGRFLADILLRSAKIWKEIPLKFSYDKNTLLYPLPERPERKKFFNLINTKSVDEAVRICNNEEVDYIIVNFWPNRNFGCALTAYAMQELVQSFGYTTKLLTVVELDKRVKKFEKNLSYTYLPFNELSILEKQVQKGVIVGSDQVFNPEVFPWKTWSPYYYFLTWLTNPKLKKIALSASFGRYKEYFRKIEWVDAHFRKLKHLMKTFDYLSTREIAGLKIYSELFGLDSDVILDPVFLIEKQKWSYLAEQSRTNNSNKIVSYIINNSNPEWNMLKKYLEKVMHVECIEISKDDENFLIEDYLKSIQNAKLVLTNSYHAVCFSIIFGTPFVCVSSTSKTVDSRFDSLIDLFGIGSNIFHNFDDVYDKEYTFQLDYEKIQKKIDVIKKQNLEKIRDVLAGQYSNNKEAQKYKALFADLRNSKAKEEVETMPTFGWLKQAFKTKKDKPSSNIVPLQNNKIAVKEVIPYSEEQDETAILHKNEDFIKIRILATLLRDYGIKHIVLSPGGRDVPLVRIFEYNEESFILHRITDERSAAYFAMGIAAQISKPVACVCTSGTAASNYLPAITEAYYTRIPLIAITADRYTVFHEHGEDQTIPQGHIYDSVVKKSITLPEGTGYRVEYQTRRDISECILETMHNVLGPVHINIAVGNIFQGAKAPRAAWALLPKIYPHILRIEFSDDETNLMRWVTELKKSQKILIVYGQNPPQTEIKKKHIEEFAKKYNCVIVTDHISNLQCAYSIQPYNMLSAISISQFNDELSPDILISVGGKRLMNDPLTAKIRGGKKNIRHWSVTPDGKIRDFYFRLSSVIEFPQDKFFEYFSIHAGKSFNNGVYYGKWLSLNNQYKSPQPKNFDTNYVQSVFLPRIPENSILHLGVGIIFLSCRKYKIHPSVEVYCNMGTNGIDGCTSTFMGQCSVVKDKLCFLMVGDLSFFYDMNSIWNKQLLNNIRIMMVNNNGSGLLRTHGLKTASAVHNTNAKGWVESTGFTYISASTKDEFEKQLEIFLDKDSKIPLFFEVFCN